MVCYEVLWELALQTDAVISVTFIAPVSNTNLYHSFAMSFLGRTLNENDKSELLQQAESMDYSSGPAADFGASSAAVRPSDLSSDLYQAGGAGPRPIQPTFASGTNRSNRYNPPRGIFDDV